MSLISEALQKARRESAGKGERRLGLLSPSHVFQRRSVWPWILTAGSLSLALGVIVGVMLRGEGEIAAPLPPTTEPSAPVSAPASSPPPATDSSQIEPPTQRLLPAPSPEPVNDVEARPVASDITKAPAIDEKQPSATEESVGEPIQIAPATTAATAMGPRDGDSFLRTVPLAGDKELVLNGIAWSESGPVALIDGRALEQGEYVQSWRVQLIEKQEVELFKDGVTIRVRLK